MGVCSPCTYYSISCVIIRTLAVTNVYITVCSMQLTNAYVFDAILKHSSEPFFIANMLCENISYAGTDSVN